MSPRLSVVMPVHDEAPHVPATIDALVEAVQRSEFDAEVVLVDDGSIDGSADVARDALADRLPLVVVSQPNRGRFEARRAGLEAASGEWVLLLDGRVRLRPESLAFVHGRFRAGEVVWNGHVHIDAEGNPYGAFWNVLVEVAWRRYFDDPRPTSYGVDDFDHFPKGTSCFLASRELLLAAVEAFVPRIRDQRIVSDDTQLIRWLAAREPIHLSPEFACDYQPRTDLRAFVANCLYRGSTFVDGHGRRESRFFPVVVVFFPLSGMLAVAARRRPAVVPLALAIGGLAAGTTAAGFGRSSGEVAAVAVLTPVFAVAYGLGMWRGLLRLALDRTA
jgi:glycosyltransferase involved in cell wall biosynthesis